MDFHEHSSLWAFNRETSNSKHNERPLAQKVIPYFCPYLVTVGVCMCISGWYGLTGVETALITAVRVPCYRHVATIITYSNNIFINAQHIITGKSSRQHLLFYLVWMVNFSRIKQNIFINLLLFIYLFCANYRSLSSGISAQLKPLILLFWISGTLGFPLGGHPSVY